MNTSADVYFNTSWVFGPYKLHGICRCSERFNNHSTLLLGEVSNALVALAIFFSAREWDRFRVVVNVYAVIGADL
jgi:hypothetical protein